MENEKYIRHSDVIGALKGKLPLHVAESVTNAINEIPAADVREVVRATWKINCDGYYPYCSHCGQEPQGREMTKFCPNCGADMRVQN